jgi:hypothetical protein
MMSSPPLEITPGKPPERAIRIAIGYEGPRLRVASRKLLAMRAPPSDPIVVPERQSGFWFQVEDVAGRLVYRKVMENPIRFDTETPSDDPEKPLRRERLAQTAGTFLLLVPLSPQAHTVRVFSSPLSPERSAQPAEEVFTFPLFATVTGEPPGAPPGAPPGEQPGQQAAEPSGAEGEPEAQR